jgi:nucleoside-diphosphate-sugar epimerase
VNTPLSAYEGTRALVLGGSGFIGRWVARTLASAGADLTVAVRDPEAAREALARHGVRAPIVTGSLRTAADVRALVGRTEPAIVFNLVGYGVDRGERDEGEMWRINRDLVRWLAEALADSPGGAWHGVRLVHTGSALEYGDVGGDLDESVPGHPTEPYGRSKLAGTEALREVARRTRLRAVTARLFTVYGDGEHAGRLLPSLVRAAESGEDLALSGGEQRRDFTHVADVAEGLLRLGVADPQPGEVVNLATGVLTSVRDFATLAGRIFEVRPERMQFGALGTRREEMVHEPVTIERLRRLTAWSPPTDVATGLQRHRAHVGIAREDLGVTGAA